MYNIDEVVVFVKRVQKEVIPVQTMEGPMLQRLTVHSVADALRYFSGVQIKDYGEIGGLKTVNIRAMGTQHVGVLMVSSWCTPRFTDGKRCNAKVTSKTGSFGVVNPSVLFEHWLGEHVSGTFSSECICT